MLSLLLMTLQASNLASTTAVIAATGIVAGPQLNVDPACTVTSSPNVSKLVSVVVSCSRDGILLGQAESFSSAYNVANNSTLVTTKYRQRAHVYLISPVDGGGYHVDEITRDLANASGRYADAGLPADLVDLGSFAASGRVKVPTLPAKTVSDALVTGGVSPAGVTTVDLNSYMVRARAMRNALLSPSVAIGNH